MTYLCYAVFDYQLYLNNNWLLRKINILGRIILHLDHFFLLLLNMVQELLTLVAALVALKSFLLTSTEDVMTAF